MTTVYTIILLIIFAVVFGFFHIFISNLVGIPGALLAGKPGNRSKSQFTFGMSISMLGQSYLYLSYTAFIVSWTFDRINNYNVINFLVWVFSFLAVVGPIWKDLIHARIEDRESKFANPQVHALHYTTFLAFVGFFIFVFFPSTMNSIWGWVPFVTK